jgi:hypothetical protein
MVSILFRGCPEVACATARATTGDIQPIHPIHPVLATTCVAMRSHAQVHCIPICVCEGGGWMDRMDRLSNHAGYRPASIHPTESGYAGIRRSRPYCRPATAPPPAGPMPREACSSGSGRRFLGLPPAPLQAPIGTESRATQAAESAPSQELRQIQEVRPPYLQEQIAGARFDGSAAPAGRPIGQRWPVPGRQPAAAAYATRSQLHDGPHGVHVLRQVALDHINTSRGVHG